MRNEKFRASTGARKKIFMSSIFDIIMRSKAFARRLNQGNSGDEYEAAAVRHLNFVPFSNHHFNHQLPLQHHLHQQQTHLPTTPLTASTAQPSLNYERGEHKRESGDLNVANVNASANVNANTILQNGHNSAASYDLEASPLYATPIGAAYHNHQQQQQHNHNNNKQGINLQSPQQNQQHLPTQTLAAAAAATSATTPASASGTAHPMYNSFFGSKAHAEDFFTQLARLRGRDDSVNGLDIQERGVYAKVRLSRGTRYGPFVVKLCSEPTAPSLAWEVIAGPHFRGWLEPSHDVATWLRKIRAVDNDGEANLKNFLVAGYLWYETNRDINAGEEITIDGRPRTPIHLNDGFANGADAGTLNATSGSLQGDDKSERDNGSLYSGGNTTGDDEYNRDRSFSEKADCLDLTDDENGFDIRCEVCDKTFPELDELDHHLVAKHSFRKDEFPCELCNKPFCHRPLLLKHRALEHNEVRKYPCENCPKVFRDPSNLQRHIRANHIGARSHACPECGKTFGTSSGLKQHTHIHSSVKPFQCEVCYKAYTQFSNLCRHKRMHADCRMQIRCPKCGQSFSTGTSLTKHKRFCDPTNVPLPPQPVSAGSGVNLPPHLPTHQQQVMQSRVLQSMNAAVAAATGNTNGTGAGLPGSGMSPADHPFVLFPPFFPNFPAAAAAYGLPGIFPPSSAQATNFPFLFPKTNLDMCMPGMPTPSGHNTFSSLPSMKARRLHNLNAGEGMRSGDVSPPSSEHSLKQSNSNANATLSLATDTDEDGKVATPLALTLASNSPNFNNNQNSFSTHNPSDEDTSSSVELKITQNDDVDVQEQEEVEEPADMSKFETSTSKLMEDDKKSIDIMSTPPPADPSDEENSKATNSAAAAELPLDLSIGRKRARTASSSSTADTQSVHSERSSNQATQAEHKSDCEQQPESNLIRAHHHKLLKRSSHKISNRRCEKLSRTPSITASPGPTPSPSPPSKEQVNLLSNDVNSSASADFDCLQPLERNPLFLEEIYHRSRTLNDIFPRPFPFLGPMGGRPAFDRALQCSDMPFPPEPVFRKNLLPAGLIGSMLATASGKIKDRYTCKYCGKVFPRSANLTRHVRTHTGEQPYTCKYCDRAFSISSNLQRHVRNIHNKERPFRCHLCDRCFGQQTNLDRHLKKHEADTNGLGIGFGDSPSSNEADREDNYLDEIRSFMGQGTYSEEQYTPTSIGGAENDTDYAGSDADVELSVSRSSSVDAVMASGSVEDAVHVKQEPSADATKSSDAVDVSS
ncbi:transcription factor hamlet isoform X1 [Bactrocera dorsalis]|uniref:Transcription factor hamlet isoform X1 n=1 Tax=Bactrocera dorsalis TaxID=27457 RepID=A0ABM3KA36_BACDO|nr:transcription factor hamlet isoform X1 [Bactrocera dorsalis]